MKIEDLIALGMTQDQAEKAVKLAEDEQAKKVAEAEAKKQSEIDALSAKNNEILSEKKALQAKQEAEQEEKAKLEYEKNKAKGDVDALTAQHNTEMQALRKKYDDFVAETHKKAIQQVAKDIATQNATSPQNAALLQKLIMAENRITIDEAGNVKILDKNGNAALDILSYTNEIKTGGEYDALIVGTGASGTGAIGGVTGAGGTKQPSDYTYAERKALLEQNPQEFNRLYGTKG